MTYFYSAVYNTFEVQCTIVKDLSRLVLYTFFYSKLTIMVCIRSVFMRSIVIAY